MVRTVTVGELGAGLAHRVPIRVAIVSVGLVVDLVRRVANVLLPVPCPVQILVAQLRRSLGVPTDNHAVDHAADQRGEAKDQKDDAEDPKDRELVP